MRSAERYENTEHEKELPLAVRGPAQAARRGRWPSEVLGWLCSPGWGGGWGGALAQPQHAPIAHAGMWSALMQKMPSRQRGGRGGG